jgi:hypothetical protein
MRFSGSPDFAHHHFGANFAETKAAISDGTGLGAHLQVTVNVAQPGVMISVTQQNNSQLPLLCNSRSMASALAHRRPNTIQPEWAFKVFDLGNLAIAN